MVIRVAPRRLSQREEEIVDEELKNSCGCSQLKAVLLRLTRRLWWFSRRDIFQLVSILRAEYAARELSLSVTLDSRNVGKVA